MRHANRGERPAFQFWLEEKSYAFKDAIKLTANMIKPTDVWRDSIAYIRRRLFLKSDIVGYLQIPIQDQVLLQGLKELFTEQNQSDCFSHLQLSPQNKIHIENLRKLPALQNQKDFFGKTAIVLQLPFDKGYETVWLYLPENSKQMKTKTNGEEYIQYSLWRIDEADLVNLDVDPKYVADFRRFDPRDSVLFLLVQGIILSTLRRRGYSDPDPEYIRQIAAEDTSEGYDLPAHYYVKLINARINGTAGGEIALSRAILYLIYKIKKNLLS